MKKFFLSLTSAAVLAGSMSIAVPEPAMARHWQGHQREVCRVVVKKKVVWQHGQKRVIRYKVKRCWWRW